MLRSPLRAHVLLKENISSLLKARGQTRRELATWCRRSEAWLSQIFTDEERNIPLKYLDRIADFFGIATYQLFQPGISPLTERRSGRQRRSGTDRRISNAVPLSQRPGDVDLMDVIRALSRDGREKAIGILGDILNDEIQRLRSRPASPGARDRSSETDEPTRAQGLGKTRKNA